MNFSPSQIKNSTDTIGEKLEVCSCKSSFPSYICSSCHSLFCRDCAKLVGIPFLCICKVCGSSCSDYNDFIQKQILQADKVAPFGIEDFKFALRFPMQDPFTNLGLALIYGALLYSMPYLGFSSVGALFGMLGVIPALIANSFMLGFNLRVINAVEHRRLAVKHVLDASEMLADLGGTVTLSCGILLITIVPYLISLLLAPSIKWLAFAWAIFYYPLALMVAASTNSFWAIINPLNGLSEIQTQESLYPKFFLFYILICTIAGGLALIILFKSLRAMSDSSTLALLPIFILLMMIIGSLIFYSNLVLSYLIGRMRFKTSY